MRSESTSALGQPRLTKEMTGAGLFMERRGEPAERHGNGRACDAASIRHARYRRFAVNCRPGRRGVTPPGERLIGGHARSSRVPETMSSSTSCSVGVPDVAVADILAALQHHDPVADREDVLQAVRDDDLGDAVLLQLEHGLEQPLGRHHREVGGRLVEDDDARLERDGAGDGDRLLAAARQALDALVDRVDVDLEALQHLRRPRAYILLAVDEEALARPAAEEDVLADVHVPAEREVLVDHLDADVAALVRALEMDRLAGDEDLAGVALVGAGEDLHQRRLAGRVVADEAEDLAGIERRDRRRRAPGPAPNALLMPRISTIGARCLSVSGIGGFRVVLRRSAQMRAEQSPKMLAWRTQMSISTATIRMTPMKTLTQCCGMVKPCDVELQQRADQRDHRRAGERADDRAVAAEDRAAADDDRGDAVELAELAGDRVEAAEIGDVDEAGHRRAERRRRAGR